MEITQAEIDFAPYLETAKAFPEAAEMKPLLDLLEKAIASKELHDQLREAGAAIEKLSEVLVEKCDRTLDKWDAKWNPREPVIPDLTDIVELFVQGQQLRLDDLLEEPEEHYYPESRKSANRCGTVVKEATPEQMLEALPTIEEIQRLAHSETVEEWVEIVRATITQRVSLRVLIQNSGLSVVQCWIAILFGGFAITRSGDFYEGEILIQNLEYDRTS